ncbi:hypothetical protein DFH06DRAFT_1401625 [Mycena polygramma]|nr:hypothetical protein DFH06DRAFT_1401625 [Mycena polygramma]
MPARRPPAQMPAPAPQLRPLIIFRPSPSPSTPRARRELPPAAEPIYAHSVTWSKIAAHQVAVCLRLPGGDDSASSSGSTSASSTPTGRGQQTAAQTHSRAAIRSRPKTPLSYNTWRVGPLLCAPSLHTPGALAPVQVLRAALVHTPTNPQATMLVLLLGVHGAAKAAPALRPLVAYDESPLWKDHLCVDGGARGYIDSGKTAGLPVFMTPEDKKLIKDSLLNGGLSGPLCWYKQMLDKTSCEDEAKITQTDIAQPLLYVAFTADIVGVPAIGDTNHAKYAKGTVTRREVAADHWGVSSHADEINAMLLEWLEGLESV